MIRDIIEGTVLCVLAVGVAGYVFILGWCFGPGCDNRWCGECWTGHCPACKELRS